MDLFAVDAMLAFFRFEKLRVVFLLLPAMGKATLVLLLASLAVRRDDSIRVPVRAHFRLISVQLWLAPIVLPVVGVDTGLAVMVILAVRAPHCLEVEKVKVHVYRVLFNKFNRYLALAVCKRTKLLVLTRILLISVQIRRAELCLVLVRMVKFLDPVMSSIAVVAIWAIRRTAVSLLVALTSRQETADF